MAMLPGINVARKGNKKITSISHVSRSLFALHHHRVTAIIYLSSSEIASPARPPARPLSQVAQQEAFLLRGKNSSLSHC